MDVSEQQNIRLMSYVKDPAVIKCVMIKCIYRSFFPFSVAFVEIFFKIDLQRTVSTAIVSEAISQNM